MGEDSTLAPPYPGRWERMQSPGTGPWSLGDIFIDLAGSQMCMRVEERHCNAFGVMHGGAMATFLDGQVVSVRRYSGTADEHTPTISLTVDYIAAAPRDAWLLVRVELQKATGSMLFTRAEVTVDDAVVARSSAIYYARKTRSKS